jgi:hypothetical protein
MRAEETPASRPMRARWSRLSTPAHVRMRKRWSTPPGLGPCEGDWGPRQCRLVDPPREPSRSPRRGSGTGTAEEGQALTSVLTRELKVATTVSNESETEIVYESLSEAGIRSMPQMSSGNIRLVAAAARADAPAAARRSPRAGADGRATSPR